MCVSRFRMYVSRFRMYVSRFRMCVMRFRMCDEVQNVIGLIPHCYCRINGITIEDRKPRGMCELIKEKLKLMLNDDPDLYPKRALARLIKQMKESKEYPRCMLTYNR